MSRAICAGLLLSVFLPVLALGQSPDAAAPSDAATAAAAVAPPAPNAAIAPAGQAGPDTGAPAQDRAAAAKSAEEARRKARAAAFEPPDGKWLVDEEGRSYFMRIRPKSETFRRMSETRIRIPYGGEYDLAGEDEENFWIKIYRPSDEPVVSAKLPQGLRTPTPEELAASAATFTAPLSEVDRLRFRSFDAGLPTTGLWRNGFDLADLDGDGEIDFVHGPPRRSGDQPRVFRGDGHGSWTPYRAAVPPGLLDYGDIKVADFNGDGKPDLAAASHLRGISVFIGDGAGKWTSWGEGLDFVVPRAGYDGSGFSSRRLEVLDWNRDGRPDLLALSEGPKLALLTTGPDPKLPSGVTTAAFGPRLYLNNGDGTWTTLAEAAGRAEIFGDDLAVADFDANGSVDFLTSTNAMSRHDLLYLQGDKVGGPWVPVSPPLRPSAYVNAVAAGDFDSDGRSDIAMSYTSFELGVTRVGVDVYLGRGDAKGGKAGKWERRAVLAREGRTGFSALDAGDLDGDKLVDLVATDHDGAMEILLGDGKGSFAREVSPETQQPRSDCRGYGLRILDLDRDGSSEIVASYAGESNPLYAPDRCSKRGGVAAWTRDLPK